MVEKWAIAVPLLGGAGSSSNTMSPGPRMSPVRRPTSVPSGILIHPPVWPQYMGQKLGAAVLPFLGRGAASPSNTVWTGLRPTSMQSFIWSIQPFGHNTPMSQTRDRTGQTGLWSGELFYKQSPNKTRDVGMHKKILPFQRNTVTFASLRKIGQGPQKRHP